MTDYIDLVKRMKVPWGGKHICKDDPDCVSSLIADGIVAIETLVKENEKLKYEIARLVSEDMDTLI